MKYRERSKVVEAMQVTPTDLREVMEWCGGTYWSRPPMRQISGLTVKTRFGNAPVPYEHWIIKHEDGEFTHMSPKDFARIYEPQP